MTFLAIAILALAVAVVYHALTRPNLSKELATMSSLDDALAANTAAVTENTTQVNALIAKISDPNTEPTQAQLDALNANTAAISANNTAAANALNPPAAEPAAPAEGA